MNRFVEFLVGVLFGFGLILSGMANPGKVIGFLDLTGNWDPSLALVMAGAIGVSVFAFAIAKGRSASLFGQAMQLPQGDSIDRRLVLGSVMFGVGWGLAGYCPGPAVVSLGSGQPKAAVFVLAMMLGMALFQWLNPRLASMRTAGAS